MGYRKTAWAILLVVSSACGALGVSALLRGGSVAVETTLQVGMFYRAPHDVEAISAMVDPHVRTYVPVHRTIGELAATIADVCIERPGPRSVVVDEEHMRIVVIGTVRDIERARSLMEYMQREYDHFSAIIHPDSGAGRSSLK